MLQRIFFFLFSFRIPSLSLLFPSVFHFFFYFDLTAVPVLWLLKSSIQSCTSAAAVPVPLPHRFHDLPPRPRHIQHKPDQEPPQPPPLPKKCAVMRLFVD
ncbi:hypothetical protein L3X38_036315 [Prunus dulcis]|uniref:Uncharacterized protein n=1 Tax=Prunus dulcis TaxID=3755 RepID=A0AAD4V1G1_PRUDU|nr:hypothetical protein L3X38_036315 [Prunus dulcis]